MKIELKQYTKKRCVQGDVMTEAVYHVKNLYGEPIGKVTVRDHRLMIIEAMGEETFSMNEEQHQALIGKIFMD